MSNLIDDHVEAKYPHNILEGFGIGALLDLRVRLAIDFIKTSPLVGALVNPDGSGVTAAAVATFSLELCDELLKQGASRGWVEPLPTDSDLDDQVRLQARRTARFNVLQQAAMQEIGRDEAARVVPLAPAFPPGRH